MTRHRKTARSRMPSRDSVPRAWELARDFIQERGLLYVFFADEWDAGKNEWKEANPAEHPDIRDAVMYFQENVMRVTTDSQTGLVTLAIDWTDPEVAATWARDLVRRVNAKLRERALQEAEANVTYLRSELSRTSLVAMQDPIGRLLESELQKVMLARGNKEFAFRVIDGAVPPKEAVWPKRALIVLVGTVLGGVVGMLGVLLMHSLRQEPSEAG
ncbi:MAG: GNVR domain-containing protein [Gemmatimonadales bacterium]